MKKEEFISKCKKIVTQQHRDGLVPVIFGRSPEEMSTPIEDILDYEVNRLYDFLADNDFMTEETIFGPTKISQILMVEDGSCDVEELKSHGYNIIVYRQGSTAPYFIEDKRE